MAVSENLLSIATVCQLEETTTIHEKKKQSNLNSTEMTLNQSLVGKTHTMLFKLGEVTHTAAIHADVTCAKFFIITDFDLNIQFKKKKKKNLNVTLTLLSVTQLH